MESVVVVTAMGIALGARHAFEPDHLAAVSTMVSERPRPRHAAALGAWWGLGHTAALVAVAIALIGARAQLAPAAERGFELAVAAMLIGLGVRSVRGAIRDGARGAIHDHSHRGHRHAHPGPPHHVHLGARALAVRPLVVGILHGLAGSGAMTALAMAEMSTRSATVGYVLAFGLGSMAGMAGVSALAALSLARLTARAATLRHLQLGAGTLAVVVGVAWGVAAL